MKRSYEVSQNLSPEMKNKLQKELRLGYLNLSEEMFEQAKMNFEIVLQHDAACADAFWGMMLVKLNVANEDFLYSNPMTYRCATELNEYKSAMQFASKEQKNIYNDLLERIHQINDGENY